MRWIRDLVSSGESVDLNVSPDNRPINNGPQRVPVEIDELVVVEAPTGRIIFGGLTSEKDAWIGADDSIDLMEVR